MTSLVFNFFFIKTFSTKKKKKKKKKNNMSDSSADTSFDESDATLILPPPAYLRKNAAETLRGADQPLTDAAQIAAEAALRERAEAMFKAREFYGATQRAWLDSACLRRHLKACKWIVEDAAALLAKVLAYRDERQIWSLRSVDDVERSARVGDQVRSGKCYRNGFDKIGRPIIYMRDRRNRRHEGFNKKFADILLHLMNCLEQASRSMALDRGVDQWVFVIDMAGFSLLGGDDMSHSRDSIDIFNAVYAERLGVAFILNAPWYFNVFYRMMAPFVDPETKVKFKVLSGSTADNLETLLQTIDKSVLESVYGGDNKCKFNFEAYYTEETKQVHSWFAHEAKLLGAETTAMMTTTKKMVMLTTTMPPTKMELQHRPLHQSARKRSAQKQNNERTKHRIVIYILLFSFKVLQVWQSRVDCWFDQTACRHFA
jgi:hypothetical protein